MANTPEDSGKRPSEKELVKKSEQKRKEFQQKMNGNKKQGKAAKILEKIKSKKPKIPETNYNKHIAAVAIILVISTAFYFDVHERILMDDEEIALQIAEENDFIKEYQDSTPSEETSISSIDPETVQNMREENRVPETSSDNIHIVDYTSMGTTGVSAYVDVDNREVVDTKYNVRY